MDFQKQKAIYLQIADYVCEQILQGVWTEKIPSIRELAVQIAVNPNTVTRTYAFLEEQGVIRIQRGIGYFVADHAKAHIVQLKKQEFLNETLPYCFKNMALLNLSFDDLKKLYQQHTGDST